MDSVQILYCAAWSYDPQAASLAAKLERKLGVKVDVSEGSFGQFDVLVGGTVVVSKTGRGLLSRLLGRGEFPDEDESVAAVKERLVG